MNYLIRNIDEAVIDSEIEVLMQISESYHKIITMTTNEADEEYINSIFQEGQILDEATGKGVDESMIVKIFKFVPRFVIAIGKKLFGKGKEEVTVVENQTQVIENKCQNDQTQEMMKQFINIMTEQTEINKQMLANSNAHEKREKKTYNRMRRQRFFEGFKKVLTFGTKGATIAGVGYAGYKAYKAVDEKIDAVSDKYTKTQEKVAEKIDVMAKKLSDIGDKLIDLWRIFVDKVKEFGLKIAKIFGYKEINFDNLTFNAENVFGYKKEDGKPGINIPIHLKNCMTFCDLIESFIDECNKHITSTNKQFQSVITKHKLEVKQLKFIDAKKGFNYSTTTYKK